MSFSNFNNADPQGTQLQNCSAGSPIGGIDNNNIFRLLKLTASGGITTSPALDPTTTPYQVESLAPQGTGIIGAKAASLALANFNILSTAVTAGLYTITPFFAIEGNTGGSVNLLLVKNSSNLYTYVLTLAYGTDTWQPTLNDLTLGGLAGVWHNLTMSKIGSGAASFALPSNSANMTKNVYLEAGSYSLIVVVDTAITTTGTGNCVAGFQNISNIG
jgi:hypothetical protein